MMQRPDYLIDTFDWMSNGYAFSTVPTADFFRGRIDKGNPWNIVGQFLYLSKTGEIPDTRVLRKIIEANNLEEPALLQACYDLIGDSARSEEINYFKTLMQAGVKNQILSACWASQWTACLDLIPPMLQVLKTQPRYADKEAVAAVISNILESETGDEELEFYDVDYDDAVYTPLVRDRIEAMKNKWPTCDRFFGGRPLDLMSIIIRFKDTVSDMVYKGTSEQESLLMLRRWFESATGVDCRYMFNNNRFSPSAALDILEAWFDNEPVRFVVGKKYFFGHICNN
jgi:hypothetical protein